MTYQVKGGTTIFINGGGKTYFDRIIKNITKIFPVDEHIAEGYLIMFILEIDDDFGWSHFRHESEPMPPPMPTGLLFYMDFVYDGDNQLPNRNGRQYVGGIDVANAESVGDVMVLARNVGYGELHHEVPERRLRNEDFPPITNLVRRVTAQAINLNLDPLD